MKKIALLDTSVFTDNMGDYIIMESTEKQLQFLLKENFVIKIPTHSPAYRGYQTLKSKSFQNYLNSIDNKFVCGTNLLWDNMIDYRPQWDINLWNSKYLKDCILVGVGYGKYNGKINNYTKKLFNQVLSKKYIHSTRDERTRLFLEELGFKAINTGCCTTWDLTQDVCSKIPLKKSENVIFTLTDYCPDMEKDQILINTLLENYKNVYFWIQGFYDLEYLHKFKNVERVQIINPSVSEYDQFLLQNDCDYIGTRLHAGIKAMQRLKRSIILIIDNRARNMHADCNLNCLEREDINLLNDMINSDIRTNINVDQSKIKDWKEQFNKDFINE